MDSKPTVRFCLCKQPEQQSYDVAGIEMLLWSQERRAFFVHGWLSWLKYGLTTFVDEWSLRLGSHQRPLQSQNSTRYSTKLSAFQYKSRSEKGWKTYIHTSLQFRSALSVFPPFARLFAYQLWTLELSSVPRIRIKFVFIIWQWQTHLNIPTHLLSRDTKMLLRFQKREQLTASPT